MPHELQKYRHHIFSLPYLYASLLIAPMFINVSNHIYIYTDIFDTISFGALWNHWGAVMCSAVLIYQKADTIVPRGGRVKSDRLVETLMQIRHLAHICVRDLIL